MKSRFIHEGDEFDRQTVEEWMREMLEQSNRTVALDTVKLNEIKTDGLTDITCAVDPDELVARGKITFVMQRFSEQNVCNHSFRIRRVGERIVAVSITDHANVL